LISIRHQHVLVTAAAVGGRGGPSGAGGGGSQQYCGEASARVDSRPGAERGPLLPVQHRPDRVAQCGTSSRRADG